MFKSLLKELRHIYGAGIIFFYYVKWPILIGLPILYYVLDYSNNEILNLLWFWSLVLAIKDFYLSLAKWYNRKTNSTKDIHDQ